MQEFRLIPGVSIPDVSAIKKEYRAARGGLTLSLSAEDYAQFFRGAVKIIGEPIFFFVEIPADNDRSRVYYLDNCTLPVAEAILKRYGGILFADGVIRFGFGSNVSDEEVYMREYQTLTVCTARAGEYYKLLEDIGYRRNDRALTAWDIISETNPGECVNVECDDEGYPEMINNLIDVGMYPQDGGQ